MRIIDLREQNLSDLSLTVVNDLLPRAKFDFSTAIEVVKPLVDAVRSQGVSALKGQASRYDGVMLTDIFVPQSAFKLAWDNLADDLKSALTEAKKRITKVHTEQLPTEHITTLDEGATVKQRWLPVQRVGLYVPGGQAVYPSSVLMNAIPAICAGAREICVASPPQKSNNGLPHPTILAACYLLGIDKCLISGGAGAIAALAYGIESVEDNEKLDRVDVITGPGNVYVAAAKALVQGDVGLDAIAGPTEIMILADKTANAKYVAADLIGQAEHDNLAGSVLVTDSADLATAVQDLLPEMVAEQMSSERISTALDGEQSAIMLVNNIKDGVIIANAYGAEHLEIQTVNASQIANEITNAGAIFVGDYSPVSLGDYIGGSNHVLPTGGTSRFSSGLNVYAFLRSVQQIEYSKPSLQAVQSKINVMANDELLPAHASAVNVR